MHLLPLLLAISTLLDPVIDDKINLNSWTDINIQNDVIIFAADAYEEFSDLDSSIINANKIKNLLNHDYNFNDTIISNPTKSTILGVLEKYKSKQYAEGRQLLVIFIGHGHIDAVNNQSYFVPVEGLFNPEDINTFVSYRKIQSEVSQLPYDHVMIITDACRSDKLRKITEIDELKNRHPIWDKFRAKKSQIFLTSGNSHKTNGTSDFTKTFLNILASKADYPNDGDGLLTMDDICKKFKSVEPTPRIGGFSDPYVRDGFVLGPVENYDVEKEEYLWLEKPSRLFDLRNNDFEVYRTFEGPNKKIWMAENLRFPSDPSNLELRNWRELKGVCPKGWHITTDEEWKTLISFCGNGVLFKNGQKKVKSNIHEETLECLIANGYFENLKGYRDHIGKEGFVDQRGYYWAPNANDSTVAYILEAQKKYVERGLFFEGASCSCRCVKDD